MKFRSAYRALAVVLVSNALAVLTSPTVSAVTKSISVTGTSSPQTGGFTPSGDGHATMIKFPGQSDAQDGSPGPYQERSSTAVCRAVTGTIQATVPAL